MQAYLFLFEIFFEGSLQLCWEVEGGKVHYLGASIVVLILFSSYWMVKMWDRTVFFFSALVLHLLFLAALVNEAIWLWLTGLGLLTFEFLL